MNVIVLDTEVFSFIFKGASQAQQYQQLLVGKRPAISFMTVAELFQWALTRNWGQRRIDALQQEMSNYLILPSDYEVCRQWALVRHQAKSKGRPTSPQDAWNAAVAIRHGLPLLTNNTKDYQMLDTLHLLSLDRDTPT